MSFKLWLENQETYYRVVCPPLYGANAVGDRVGPNTYWTPRWDAVIRMLRSIMQHWYITRRKLNTSPWEVKIYQLNNAVWKNSPEEHKWAFKYAPDAGEQVLEKALTPPKLIYQFNVTDPEFLELTKEPVEKMIDYAAFAQRANLVIQLNGKEAYIHPGNGVIEIAVRNPGTWSYSVIKTIRSMTEWSDFIKTIKIPDNFDDEGALSYFFLDYNWI